MQKIKNVNATLLNELPLSPIAIPYHSRHLGKSTKTTSGSGAKVLCERLTIFSYTLNLNQIKSPFLNFAVSTKKEVKFLSLQIFL